MTGVRKILLGMAAGAALVTTLSCRDGSTDPGQLRFGQIGEVRLHLSTPQLLGQGELQQSLTWSSSGPWQLTETISYRTTDTTLVAGGENTFRSSVNPEALAFFFAIWITQVHDHPGLQLFIPELEAPLEPECGPADTRVTLVIRDAVLDQDRRWIRCAEGALSGLVPARADSDPAASRVAEAARLLRDYLFPPPSGFLSSFHASLPFATLARGETPVPLDAPWLIESEQVWNQFWATHAGTAAPQPVVDFSSQVVLVAAIGQRFEAGETVEIRRVLPVAGGTLVQIVWSVPGNFCSPVSRTHRPVHVVVAPSREMPRPIRFAQIQRQEVPCGA